MTTNQKIIRLMDAQDILHEIAVGPPSRCDVKLFLAYELIEESIEMLKEVKDDV